MKNISLYITTIALLGLFAGGKTPAAHLSTKIEASVMLRYLAFKS